MMTDLELLKNRWMQTEAPKFHNAFKHPSHISDQRAAWGGTKPAYDLRSALEHYKTLEGCPNLTFDPARCSWADVFQLLSEAEASYKRKAQGFSGSIRKVFRIAGDQSEAIEPLLYFIPDEAWGSALRVSLGWMFSLLKSAAKNRMRILSAFKDIPGIIMAAEAKQKNFKGDVYVTELVGSLFDTVIKITTKFITYLLPEKQVFKIFPFCSRVPTGDDIDHMIKELQQAVSALDQRTDILKDGMLVNIQDYLQKSTQQIQSELHITRQVMQQDSQEIKKILSSSEQETIRAINAAKDELIHAANGARKGMWNMMDEFITTILPIIQAREYQSEQNEIYLRGRLEAAEMELKRARTPQLPGIVSPSLSVPELQNVLCAPLQIVTRDFDYVLQQGVQMDHMQQSQAQWVLQQQRLLQWISINSPDMVLVHGDLMGISGDHVRISSLSVVCATIIASLARTESETIGLYYFCGLHMSSEDDLEGPQGLMRCLIARLLVELDTVTGSNTNMASMDSGLMDGLDRRDIRYLCALFSFIVGQFPSNTTIYCMIDGITWYERSHMREDLDHVVQSIYGIVDSPYCRCQFKVLITNPFRSGQSVLGIPAYRQIRLQAEPLMLEASSIPFISSDRGFMQTKKHVVSLIKEVNWTDDDFT